MLASAGNLLVLFLGLEITIIPTYALVAFRTEEDRSYEAGLKYFVLSVMLPLPFSTVSPLYTARPDPYCFPQWWERGARCCTPGLYWSWSGSVLSWRCCPFTNGCLTCLRCLLRRWHPSWR